MGAKDLIADSRLAFLNQENETALNLARRAIALEPSVCRWRAMMRRLKITARQ